MAYRYTCLNLNLDLNLDLHPDLDLGVDLDLDMDLNLVLNLDLDLELDLNLDLGLDLGLDLDLDLELDLDLGWIWDPVRNSALARHRQRSRYYGARVSLLRQRAVTPSGNIWEPFFNYH